MEAGASGRRGLVVVLMVDLTEVTVVAQVVEVVLALVLITLVDVVNVLVRVAFEGDVVVVLGVLVIMAVVVVVLALEVFCRSSGCVYARFGGGTCARRHRNRGRCRCAQSRLALRCTALHPKTASGMVDMHLLAS